MTDPVSTSPDGIAPLSPAGPLGYMSPPANPRRWHWSEIISCIAIVGLVIFALFHSTAEQAAPETQESTDDMSVLIAGRLTVGAHRLLNGNRADEAPLIAQMDAAAKSPRDKFHAAIVHGELESPDAALQRADALAEKYPDLRDDVATLHTIYTTREKPPAAIWTPFHENHNWFADLALATAKPPGDPDRENLLDRAATSLAEFGFVFLGVMLALVAGMILLVLALVLFSKGTLKPAFPRTARAAPDRRAFLEGFTLYVGGILLLGTLMRDVFKWPSMVVVAIELPADIALGLAWPKLMGQSWAAWRAALGWQSGAGFFREVGCGLMGYLAGMPLMAVGFMITAMLARLSGVVPSHPINEVLQRGWIWILFALLLASVWAPITEELMFRGAFFSWMRQRYGWWISAPVVALVFAMIHPQGWIAVPVLASIAIVLAGIREWRGSTIGCMAAHCLHNTITLLVVVILLG